MKDLTFTLVESKLLSIRVAIDEFSNPWFVANDIAKSLGYINYRNSIVNHVDNDDKLRTQIEYAGKKREVIVINESGLYSLIMGSQLPTAKQFKHWITSEVLPELRRKSGLQVWEIFTMLDKEHQKKCMDLLHDKHYC